MVVLDCVGEPPLLTCVRPNLRPTVTWCFFRNAVSPRRGLQLRNDHVAGWAYCRAEGGFGDLWANGTLLGVYMGDEVRVLEYMSLYHVATSAIGIVPPLLVHVLPW